MFIARAALSPHLTEQDIGAYCQSFDMADIGLSVHRERDDGMAPWIVEWSSANHPDVKNLAVTLAESGLGEGIKINLEKISDDIDWRAQTYKGFAPFTVGPFFVHGSHYDGQVPAQQMPLVIDAATAFGSGEHPTTKGCLRAMIDMKSRGACPWNVLDMGTGSGILAIAAWKLWKAPVLAVDNDPEAEIVAARYRDLNGVPSVPTGMTCATGDGYNTPAVQDKKPYELIIANILAGPLIEMAPQAAAVSDMRGYLILSGLLRTQAQDVIAAYQAVGYAPEDRFDIEEWATVLMRLG